MFYLFVDFVSERGECPDSNTRPALQDSPAAGDYETDSWNWMCGKLIFSTDPSHVCFTRAETLNLHILMQMY
jgi:hypothetical protein